MYVFSSAHTPFFGFFILYRGVLFEHGFPLMGACAFVAAVVVVGPQSVSEKRRHKPIHGIKTGNITDAPDKIVSDSNIVKAGRKSYSGKVVQQSTQLDWMVSTPKPTPCYHATKMPLRGIVPLLIGFGFFCLEKN